MNNDTNIKNKKQKVGFCMHDHNRDKFSDRHIDVWQKYWLLYSVTINPNRTNPNTGNKWAFSDHDTSNKILEVCTDILRLKPLYVEDQGRHLRLASNAVYKFISSFDKNILDNEFVSTVVPVIQQTKMLKKVTNTWKKMLRNIYPDLTTGEMNEVIVWLEDALTFQFETVRKCHSTYWVLSSINDICIDITAKNDWAEINVREQACTDLLNSVLRLRWRTATLRTFTSSLLWEGEDISEDIIARSKSSLKSVLLRITQNNPERHNVFSWRDDWDEPLSNSWYDAFFTSLKNNQRHESRFFRNAYLIAKSSPSNASLLFEIADLPPTAYIAMFCGFLYTREKFASTALSSEVHFKLAQNHEESMHPKNLLVESMQKSLNAVSESVWTRLGPHFRKFVMSQLQRWAIYCPEVVALLLRTGFICFSDFHDHFVKIIVKNSSSWTNPEDFQDLKLDMFRIMVDSIPSAEPLIDFVQNNKDSWDKTIPEDSTEIERHEAERMLLGYVMRAFEGVGNQANETLLSLVLSKWNWSEWVVIELIPREIEILNDRRCSVSSLKTMLAYIPQGEYQNYGFLERATCCKENIGIFKVVLEHGSWSKEDLDKAMKTATYKNYKEAVRLLLNHPYKVLPPEEPPQWVMDMVEDAFSPNGAAFKAVLASYTS